MHETRIATRWTDFDAWPSVVARVEADFRREVLRGARELVVRSRVTGVGRSSVRVTQELLAADGEVAVDAAAVLVAFDPVMRGSRPIEDAERARLLDAG